jgi:CheY-like chemotaxis protein
VRVRRDAGHLRGRLGGRRHTLRPGLVFIDVHLPGAMDAVDAAAAIWAQQRIPIIYLTGDAPSALLNGVQTPPPVFTLSKPFSEAALQEVLAARWHPACNCPGLHLSE